MKHKGELVIHCACIFIFLLFDSFIYVYFPRTSQGAFELMWCVCVCPETIGVFSLLIILICKSAASEVITEVLKF